MRDIPVIDLAGLAASERAALEEEVRGQRTLSDVLARASEARPRRVVVEIVTQDEYTHDVVLALEPPRHLVYDTT
jgi:hypothetical protein